MRKTFENVKHLDEYNTNLIQIFNRETNELLVITTEGEGDIDFIKLSVKPDYENGELTYIEDVKEIIRNSYDKEDFYKAYDNLIDEILSYERKTEYEIFKEKNKMRYKDLYLIRHLNGERNFKNEVTVFNHHETDELFYGDPEKVKKIAFEYYQKTFGVEQAEHLIDSQPDITRITIDIENKNTELIELYLELSEHSETVSGDDDSYDYFPDLIYAFRQICKQLGELDYFKTVASVLNERLNYSEGDELYIE